MSERNTILQAVRTWVKAWAADSALTDAQVISGHPGGTRPALPYMSVFVYMVGGVVGFDETVYALDEDEEITYVVQGERTASVQIHGYGAGSEDWLDRIQLNIHDPLAVAAAQALGVVIGTARGGLKAIPRAMNGSDEPHYVIEVPVTYRKISDIRTGITAIDVVDIDTPAETDEVVLDISVATP